MAGGEGWKWRQKNPAEIRFLLLGFFVDFFFSSSWLYLSTEARADLSQVRKT